MLKFVGDCLETWLRRIETSDRSTALTRPESTIFPILGKRFESSVYDSTARQERTPFDSLMNLIVIFAILSLFLEWALGAFSYQFAILNCGILVCFVLEFFIRWNFRRSRYLVTWGMRVDGPIILVETLILYVFFVQFFELQSLTRLMELGIDIGSSGTSDESQMDWLDKLGIWKLLRLARFLRVIKLLKDIAKRPDLWKRRVQTLVAWLRGTLETLSILMVIAIILIVITRVFSSQNPEELLRSFIRNLLARLRADQDTGVKNSEVLKALYQVFTILSGMIIVTFFTQLLLPIVNRIKAAHQYQIESGRRKDHVIIAVADEASIGLLEEAIQIWAIYEKSEVVLLLPEGIDQSDAIHPSYTPHVVAGSVFSRASWLAADSDGARQIVLLCESHVDPETLSTFIPISKRETSENCLLILSSDKDATYSTGEDTFGGKYTILGIEPLTRAIEDAIGSRSSVQYRLTEQLNEKFDKAVSILGEPAEIGDVKQTAKNLRKHLKIASKTTKLSITERDGIVSVELLDNPDETEEGNILRLLREFLAANADIAPILVFVESLHLVGVNAQLGNKSQLRVVPIELLVMYAAYHETVCRGIAQAWLLKADALSKEEKLLRLKSGLGRTTYRNRSELREIVKNQLPDRELQYEVIGVIQTESNIFRGFLTNSLDTRKLLKNDEIIVVQI